jgi:SAM-dependent methyltransferase
MTGSESTEPVLPAAGGREPAEGPPPAPPGILENHLGGESAKHYRQYELDLVSPHCGRSVLEVGSGLGDFAAALTGLDRLVVSDTEPWLLDRLRERFADRPEVEVVSLALPGPVEVDPPLDTVVAMNVLEHVDDDVTALRNLAAVVQPGGRLVIWVPAYPALYGDFDRRVGHVRRYTPKTLRAAVDAADLATEILKPVNLLGGMAWWLAVRRGGAGYPDARLVKLYDRLLIPTTRLIERFMTPPFGQSIICVARVKG